MKKLLITLCVCASFTSNAQTNANLSTMIDPARNRGYLKWPGDGSPQYRVNVYEQQDTAVVVIGSQTTGNTYVKFQPLLFTLPNLSYQVVALDENGNVLSEGEVTPNELCVGCQPAIPICEIECNGRSYAWKLTAYEGDYFSGWQQFMQLTDTYQYIDAETGIRVPHWQAFSHSSFDNLPEDHPYTRIVSGFGGAGGRLYQKMT